jgi:hypothetical protein
MLLLEYSPKKMLSRGVRRASALYKLLLSKMVVSDMVTGSIAGQYQKRAALSRAFAAAKNEIHLPLTEHSSNFKGIRLVLSVA